jgi:hypothetical protein
VINLCLKIKQLENQETYIALPRINPESQILTLSQRRRRRKNGALMIIDPVERVKRGKSPVGRRKKRNEVAFVKRKESVNRTKIQISTIVSKNQTSKLN